MNLKTLYRTAPVGLCYFDTDLRYLYVNDWLANINGLTVEQHIGQRIIDILPGVAAGVESQLRGVIETGNPVVRGTACVETAAHLGSRRHYEHNFYPDTSDDGTVVGLSCVIQDVTERTEAAKTIERVNADLELFGHSLFHEIREPLITIGQFSAILSQDIGGSLDHQHREYLDRIVSAARVMSGTLDGLRDVTMVTTEEVQQESVDLSSLAKEIIGGLRELEPDRSVEFEAEDGLITKGNPSHMRLLLLNLLRNAWKFTAGRDPARIHFGAEPDRDDRSLYYVRDNGVGFDNARSEDLFEPFQQLHRDQEFEGSGIGLTTARRVVRSYGGEIWGESPEGEGATFRFSLRKLERRRRPR